MLCYYYSIVVMRRARTFSLIFLSIGLLAAGGLPVQVFSEQTYIFTRTLQLGSRGLDVKELQRVLNRQTVTQLASFGSGSPGNETEVFGFLTKQAVIRFQELHRESVLAPAGLQAGTGVVGLFTRAVLNRVAPVSSALPATEPVLLRTAPQVARPGGFITIYGSSLFGPSTVRLGSVLIPASSKDTSTVSFAIPQGTVAGSYALSVEVGGKRSNEISVLVQTTAALVAPPVVSSISPSRGGAGTVLTITGSGFAQTGNSVYTGYGVMSGVASADSKTLQVTINPPFGAPRSGLSYTVPLWIYVASDGGISNEAIFTYQP